MQDETIATPSFAAAAALLGDPARARMMAALMDGRARTATELAAEGMVAASTASAHLARLAAAGMVEVVRQGRHRYHRIASDDVAATIEALMQAVPPSSGRYGPRQPAMRAARVCYDHLAGTLGVALADAVVRAGVVHGSGDRVTLTAAGSTWLRDIGIDPAPLVTGRRPVCRFCLDWSERRSHLAGALGAALLQWLLQRRLLARTEGSRALKVRAGAQRFVEQLQAMDPALRQRNTGAG